MTHASFMSHEREAQRHAIQAREMRRRERHKARRCWGLQRKIRMDQQAGVVDTDWHSQAEEEGPMYLVAALSETLAPRSSGRSNVGA